MLNPTRPSKDFTYDATEGFAFLSDITLSETQSNADNSTEAWKWYFVRLDRTPAPKWPSRIRYGDKTRCGD